MSRRGAALCTPVEEEGKWVWNISNLVVENYIYEYSLRNHALFP